MFTVVITVNKSTAQTCYKFENNLNKNDLTVIVYLLNKILLPFQCFRFGSRRNVYEQVKADNQYTWQLVRRHRC